jgi:Caspase domain
MKYFLNVILITILSLSNTSIQPSNRLGIGVSGKGVDSDLYILSIGVSKYNIEGLVFTNCTSDAKKANAFFKNQFELDSTSIIIDSTVFNFNDVYSYTLFDEQATYSNIDSIFQIISEIAKPEDFFVFFFAGFSWDFGSGNPLQKGTYFFSFIKESLNLTDNELKTSDQIYNQIIPLHKLKTWFELIPADKQLIITEAGPNKNFLKEFTTSLIEKDNLVSQLTNKNRIILTSTDYGRDNAFCDDGNSTGGGPLLHFIEKLPTEINIFQLFDDHYKEMVKYNIIKNEIDCGCFKSQLYSAIYFEKDILEIISETGKSYLMSRGTKLLDEGTETEIINPDSIKNYALIIGTDNYDAASWSALTNPVFDATSIANKLKENYLFETSLLINPTRTEILQSLLNYNQMKYDSLSQLFIFIAGHGNYDEFSKGIIAAKDSKNPDDDPFADSYISHSKLRDILDGIKCNHIMVVLDVCFGGTFNQSITSHIVSEGSIDISYEENSYATYPGFEASKSEYILRKLGARTRLYMTSGGKEYVPDGIPGRHSPFASKFISALESEGGDDGILTYGEIKSFVEKLNPWPRGGTFGSKSDGDFLFISKTN